MPGEVHCIGVNHRTRARQQNVACLSFRRGDVRGCCRGFLCHERSRFGRTPPFASLNERTSSALAWPCSLTCAPLIPLRGRQSNELRLSMPRNDVPRAAIVGATSLVIHCATASAIGQRSITGGEKTMRCLSGKNTASTLTTSVAMHLPGPVIGGDGSKAASSASRN